MTHFVKSRWYSHRVQQEVTLARWGYFGQPLLLVPTAGGDAEECERWLMIKVLEPLLVKGAIKVYSCDSVAGQAWFQRDSSPEHRMWLMNQFQEYIRHEVVPAIYLDCRSDGLPIWAAGASIGAYHAVSLVCRYPDVFFRAIGMSGTYDLMRFIETDHFTHDYFVATALRFLPYLSDQHKAILRQRFVLLASGQGHAENIGESWNMARMLGEELVPNWMADWGHDWPHDWQTWRAMLPKYLTEWTER